MLILIRDCDSHFNYAIVREECFGTSTALTLKREWLNARIIWFESSVTRTVSKDINKIIRATYSDKNYVAFAEQAMRMWKEAVSYRNYFHQTFWVQVIDDNSDRRMMKRFKNRLISTHELVHMIESHEKPKLDTEEKLSLNENIGYVDSALAVKAVAEKAFKLDVKREKKDVTRLVVNEEVCLKVEADNCTIFTETTIIVAGPWTSDLL